MIYKLFPVEKLMDFYTGLNYRSKSMSIIQGYRPVVVKRQIIRDACTHAYILQFTLYSYIRRSKCIPSTLYQRDIFFLNPTFVNAFGYAINKHGGTRRFWI